MCEDWITHTKKLGFGLMRLPMDADGKTIDMETVKGMVDRFLSAGFTYFDTAYGYMDGRSESIAREALVSRHARESFTLATKLPLWEIKKPEDMARIFALQLERTGAGYFDYYLLHAMHKNTADAMEPMGAWAFLKEQKAKGLIRRMGFSFHDTAAVLDEILTRHPEAEFVQLQINYADWEDGGIQSRLCYEVARRHGVPIIVMEPVKGGALATLSKEAVACLKAANPEASPAAWAIRYAASLPGVVTVLSGMSNLAQMEDNLATMQDFAPLSQAEQQVIEKVRDIMASTPTIACTDCKYCTENCPQNIPIPRIFAGENKRRVYGQRDVGHYENITKAGGRASDCIACGVCEGRCPQHLPIIQLLADAAAVFEGP